ncbi:hypothetical protein ACFWDI_24790 [Streptomyces sp. NPDC060064]
MPSAGGLGLSCRRVDAPEEKTEALAATKQLLNLLKLIDHDPLP